MEGTDRMVHDQPTRNALTLVISTGILVSMTLVCGCSAKKKIVFADAGDKERITESAFFNPDAPAVEQPTISSPAPVAQTSSQGAADSFTLSSGSRPAQIPVTQSANTAANTPAGGLELLDAKVGDINGHPIYANSFFAPIQDRLIAESESMPPNQWQRSAARIVATRLDGIISDELLRAEALASLSQQQRLGLRSFLKGFRSDLLSRNLGSQELANRRVLEEQGITLNEALHQQEVDTLIRLTLFREINRRVNVSWRDIKQRYERDIEKYSPPPTAVFRRIRVFTSSADDIAEVNKQLAEDTPFHYIAASELNTFKPETGGEESFVIEDGFKETEFYGIDILNEKAWSLSVGEWTGPFESGSSTYWIKLEGIEQDSTTLYDAQLGIQREITYERRQEQQREYLDRLIDRAHFTSRDEILIELIEIAFERYGPIS